MILLIDTSTPYCHLSLYREGNCVLEDTWHAERMLAEGIFTYITEKLSEVRSDLTHVSGIGIFRGPGSFTGLRIGMTVCNTLAYDQTINIVGETGKNWQKKAILRLMAGENERIVLPEYGSPARITTPRK